MNINSILITGGYGFIGSNFIRFLRKKLPNLKIYNLDKLTYAANIENLKDFENDKNYIFVRGDIKDSSILEILYPKVDAIVHFAAETHVDRSIIAPGEFILTEVYGTFTLLETMKKYKNIKLFLHISTDEIYGSIEKGSFKENSPLNPSSPYSASKTGADRLAYSYFKTFDLPVIIARPSNNYGPFQHVEKFIPLFITNALENKPLPLYGKGENMRDWLYVLDNCEALFLLMEKGEIGEAYNIGANNEIKNIDIAKKIVKFLGKDESLIEFVEDRKGHDLRYSIDWTKIKNLGWKPKKKFEDGLRETIEWYKSNRQWWEKVKRGVFCNFYKKDYKREIQ